LRPPLCLPFFGEPCSFGFFALFGLSGLRPWAFFGFSVFGFSDLRGLSAFRGSSSPCCSSACFGSPAGSATGGAGRAASGVTGCPTGAGARLMCFRAGFDRGGVLRTALVAGALPVAGT